MGIASIFAFNSRIFAYNSRISGLDYTGINCFEIKRLIDLYILSYLIVLQAKHFLHHFHFDFHFLFYFNFTGYGGYQHFWHLFLIDFLNDYLFSVLLYQHSNLFYSNVFYSNVFLFLLFLISFLFLNLTLLPFLLPLIMIK